MGVMGGGVDLTIRGGGVICSKVILVPQKILNKTSNFWHSVSKIKNWHKMQDYFFDLKLKIQIHCMEFFIEWIKNFM